MVLDNSENVLSLKMQLQKPKKHYKKTIQICMMACIILLQYYSLALVLIFSTVERNYKALKKIFLNFHKSKSQKSCRQKWLEGITKQQHLDTRYPSERIQCPGFLWIRH